MVGLLMENPIKMDDLGVPLFQETTIWMLAYTEYTEKMEHQHLGWCAYWLKFVFFWRNCWFGGAAGRCHCSERKKTKKQVIARNDLLWRDWCFVCFLATVIMLAAACKTYHIFSWFMTLYHNFQLVFWLRHVPIFIEFHRPLSGTSTTTCGTWRACRMTPSAGEWNEKTAAEPRGGGAALRAMAERGRSWHHGEIMTCHDGSPNWAQSVIQNCFGGKFSRSDGTRNEAFRMSQARKKNSKMGTA